MLDAADIYDRVYGAKLYEFEALQLRNMVEAELGPARRSLLDVACGTGRHLEYLKNLFEAEGVDISRAMLARARERNPEVPLYRRDMRCFNLGRCFDVVVCLFSAIGHAKNTNELQAAIQCMASHVAEGGLLVVEPWYTPRNLPLGTVHSIVVEESECKLARFATCRRNGGITCILQEDILAATAQQVVRRRGCHEMGLFETEDMQQAFQAAGLCVRFQQEGLGLSDKGLFVGRRAA